jgi:hypothetical protein
MIEAIHGYIAQVLRKLSYEDVRTIEPKRKSVLMFTNFCKEFFKETVFSAKCASWYKNPTSGEVTALWPGSSVHAVKALEKPRWEDFEFEPVDKNEFGWFGNGETMADRITNPEGLSWYLNDKNFLTSSR